MGQAETLNPEPPAPAWEKAGTRRRIILILLVFAPSVFAATIAHGQLPTKAGPFINTLIAGLFTLLFAWVAVGFWSALAGIVITLRRYDRHCITCGPTGPLTLPEGARAAILFPVYNEDAHKVVEEIRTVWRSLKATGASANFDIFMLSDSTNPDAWAREEEAWHTLRREEDAEDRIFYRHRRINRKGKSGNVADFCRRWGANYPYMIVFDADSLMSAETLIRMVQAMERNPDVGILQTAPKSINSRTLTARVQQFSNHLYGPVFAAGLHFWQLGDAQYWGHNAIIRVKPFMDHCHLPTLSGRAPLGGNILSHDFVEAALMRRAGYGVWLAYDLDGSYEENPPSLIDELIRDRRWCQGNLQHGRLLLTRGFFPTHRALFINGIMSYGSALLWFLFLLASSGQAILELIAVPNYFPEGYSLFPDWPKYLSHRTLGLFASTAVLLFLPKLLTLLVVTFRGDAKGFGGRARLWAGAAAELILSALLAPVRMVYHSFFVVTTLLGHTVRWNTQNRDDSGTTWLQAARFHWWGVAIGLLWGAAMYLVNPGFFLWLSPIIAGLVLSIPMSVLTSRPDIGEAALRLGLFLTPADTAPPPILAEFRDNLRRTPPPSPFRIPAEQGFVRAVTVPSLFALHMTLLRRGRPCDPEKDAMFADLVDKALRGGPDGLTAPEKRIILSEPECLAALHKGVWRLEGRRACEWGIV